MVSRDYWAVMRDQHAEARQREDDAKKGLQGAKTSVTTTLHGKAEEAKESQDEQIDANFAQARTQIAAAIASMCSGGEGGEAQSAGGGGGGAQGGGAGGAQVPTGVAAGEGSFLNDVGQFLLRNSGLAGAAFAGGKELGSAALNEIPLLGAILQAADSEGKPKANLAEVQRLPMKVLSDVPASLERAGASSAEDRERAFEELAGAAQERSRRNLARLQREQQEAREAEEQLLRAQQNPINLA